MFCSFDSHNLGSGDYEVLEIDHSNPPKSIINKYQLVRADGEKVTDKRYGQRTVTVKGRILADNRKQMDERLDTLKSYMTGTDKNLDIYVADVTRRFVATCEGFTTTVSGYLCEWVALFTCEAFGREIAATTLAVTSPYVTSPQTNALTFGGTFNARPIFDITVVQAEPFWQNKYLDIENTALNKRLRLTRTWNWYDRLIVNADAKTVTLYPTTKTIIDACDVTTGWTSGNTLSLEATNMKEGVGALKVVQGSATATADWIRLNATAIDLSATAGKVIIPVFIPTPTSGTVASLDLVMGSDATLASNTCYYRKTTQWDGSAIASNAWNWFEIDLSLAVTGTTASPVRTAIKSIKIVLNSTGANMQLNGVLLDYITLQKASIVPTTIDYEGIFADYEPGAGTIKISDELTSRNMTVAATYFKRYL